MARVLWVTAETPDADGHGGQRRQYHLLRELLTLGHEILVAYLRSEQSDESLRALASSVGLDSGRTLSMRYRSSFDDLVDEMKPQVILVSHAVSARLIPATFRESRIPILIDFHNVESRWFLSQGRRREAQKSRRLETRLLRRSAPIVCSDEERVGLLGHSGRPAVVAPQGADPAEWPAPPEPDTTSPFLATFGSLWYPVHRVAVEWFVREVFPAVRATHPQVRYVLFGPGPPEGIHDPDHGIEVEGWVQDLAASIGKASAIVVPTLAGPGSRVKFPEAVMSGVPVVATSVAAEGFDADGFFRRTDNPETMALACQQILDSPSTSRLSGLQAREHALRCLTWKASAERLAKFIERIIAEHGGA